MLESISWQQFVWTVAVLTGCYYLIAGLLLYSGEIKAFFKKRSSPRPLTGIERMGEIRYTSTEEEGVSREATLETEALTVAPTDDSEEPVVPFVPPDATQTDAVNLTQEVNTLLEVTSTANVEECASFFQAVLSRYPQLVGTPHQHEISHLILTSLKASSLQVELGEVNSWWPQSDHV